MTRCLVLALALALGLAPAVSAQGAKGAIYGTVHDETGAALPGATVTLTGPTVGKLSTTSSSEGAFRFLNLDPATYRLTVSLTGFGTQDREVVVNSGVNLDLSFNLKVSAFEEAITITAETPVVDTKKAGTSTTLTKEELQGIPNSRDPWAVLRTIPGVMVDRLNIAGSESGQQSFFIGKGAVQTDATWTLDGVVINDGGAAGTAPTYFDYDAFEEINVSTGGKDLKVSSGGLGLNFVTKRGTNAFHGGAGGYFAHDDFQFGNVPEELKGDPRLRGSDRADHTDQIADYGAELGGPIVKDKLWFFGSYGKQDIRIVRLNQTKDRTILKDYTGKLNWQAGANDMVSLLYFNGQKLKYGRAVTSGMNEDASYTRNQGNDGKYPLYGIVNLEWSHVFNSNLFATVKLSRQNTGFNLTPRGGRQGDDGRDFVANRAYGSSDHFESVRPQHSGNLDVSHFRSGWDGNHELKFGFAYRHTRVDSSLVPSGSQVRAITLASGSHAQVRRELVASFGGQAWSAYVGDTFTRGRVTANIGLRVDRQTAENRPSTASANAMFPELLPDLAYDGSGQGIEWTDLSPRASLTYALCDSRRTLVRASFARYASLLPLADVSMDNPIGGNGLLQYGWNDRNGDRFVQRDEVDIAGGLTSAPQNATLVSVNRIDADYQAPKDNELILGLEHELLPNFSVAVTGTYRRTTHLPWAPFIGVDNTGWEPRDPIIANTPEGVYTARPYYMTAANAAAAQANEYGQILLNRPGYHRQFKGAELTATKRLANKWMLRAAVAYSDWTEHFDGREGIQNPTPALYELYGAQFIGVGIGQSTLSDAMVDGGQVGFLGLGSGKGYWINAKWMTNVSALYQLPAGFEIAGNLYGRQGYLRPTTIDYESGLGRVFALATPRIDDVRTPDVWNLDLRAAKHLRFGKATVDLTADVFNVLNANTVLARTGSALSEAFNQILEIQAPRIARFGVRLGF